jgi:quercetin dioxygenase-like cupin family protein
MSRLRTVTCLAILMTLITLGASTHPSRAQQATPTAELVTRTFETLGRVEDLALAPGMTLQLERYTWMPGQITEMHTHPAEIDIMYVQSGEIAWSVENGDAQVTHATVDGTPGPSETLQPGTEVTLHAGDVVVFDYTNGLQHQGRVVGDVPAVMLVAYIYDPTKQT